MGKNKGTLYLIPCTLGSDSPLDALPQHTLKTIHQLELFIVEDFKSGRNFVKQCEHPKAIQSLNFEHFDKKTDHLLISEIMEPLLSGKDMGVISEAGCPGVADPGSALVHYAHLNQIKVVPLIGPNSIIQALMASGFNGQNFCFHGYLPKNTTDLKKKIQQMEKQISDFRQTQIFIETPYRTTQLIDTVLSSARKNTKFCIAANINQNNEVIKSDSIENWRKNKINFDKSPAVFLLY